MRISLTDRPPTTCDPDEHPTTVLLTAAVGGDPLAWRDIVHRYRHVVTSTARRYRLSPEEAADVEQTTWLRLVENVRTIRDPTTLAAWLRTTAAREALRLRHRASREVAMPVDDAPDRLIEDVDDHVIDRLMAGRLRRAVVLLPDRERRLLTLLLMPEELSYLEIGRRLSMPVGSIGPVRGRAIDRLRRILTGQEAAA